MRWNALACATPGLALCVLAFPLHAAAPLVPPPGYYARPLQTPGPPHVCEPAPQPYTGPLVFTGKYRQADPGSDEVDPEAHQEYLRQTAAVASLERGVSSMVGLYMVTEDESVLDCLLGWLGAWAEAAALTAKSNNETGRSVRKWALATLSSSYLRLKFSEARPLRGRGDRTRPIEQWLTTLMDMVYRDWRSQALDKVNNRQYWAGWAVMASAVLLNRREYFDWSLEQFQLGAMQVDRDGYMRNEMRRQSRALEYHNYALGPLAMMAAFAKANSVDLGCVGDGSLQRLAALVLRSAEDPAEFSARIGVPQAVDAPGATSKLAWLEPYCWAYGCRDAWVRALERNRPLTSHRLGGNLTALFGD